MFCSLASACDNIKFFLISRMNSGWSIYAMQQVSVHSHEYFENRFHEIVPSYGRYGPYVTWAMYAMLYQYYKYIWTETLQ